MFIVMRPFPASACARLVSSTASLLSHREGSQRPSCCLRCTAGWPGRDRHWPEREPGPMPSWLLLDCVVRCRCAGGACVHAACGSCQQLHQVFELPLEGVEFVVQRLAGLGAFLTVSVVVQPDFGSFADLRAAVIQD